MLLFCLTLKDVRYIEQAQFQELAAGPLFQHIKLAQKVQHGTVLASQSLTEFKTLCQLNTFQPTATRISFPGQQQEICSPGDQGLSRARDAGLRLRSDLQDQMDTPTFDQTKDLCVIEQDQEKSLLTKEIKISQFLSSSNYLNHCQLEPARDNTDTNLI